MEKFFDLKGCPYGKVNAIRVYSDYSKREGGYCVTAEFIERYPDGMYSKLFSREYYQHDGDGSVVVCPTARRNAKKEAAAAENCSTNAREYADKFLKHALEKLNLEADSVTII